MGHDAFLMEFQQLEKLLKNIFKKEEAQKGLKILKFGGKSLSNGHGLEHVLEIIEQRKQKDENIAVVLSARQQATDTLESLLKNASKGVLDKSALKEFEQYQKSVSSSIDYSKEFAQLSKRLEGVSLVGDYSLKTKDEVLSIGELISCRLVVSILKERGINAVLIDARELLQTDSNFGDAQINQNVSKTKVLKRFANLESNSVPIITGFIASNEKGETTTLGRNGSNYTAALFANYLDAVEVLNYTHVDGIFTANPDYVKRAKIIEDLSYGEANELANFGAKVLHAKTIIPLIEKNIPLRILNTFNPDSKGTLISSKTKKEGIKSLSVIEDVAMINLEGRGLLGKVGIDARIFTSLGRENINVSIISQGSSERGIGLVVASVDAKAAKKALDTQFATDFSAQDVNTITIKNDISVISIVGQDLSTFHHPYNALIKNGIVPLLFNNTITGKNISLVVENSVLHKALNVMHGQIFGVNKRINLAIFGHGTVGGTLIDQILKSHKKLQQRKGLDLRIFSVANSKKVLLNAQGIKSNWKATLEKNGIAYNLNDVIKFAKDHHLENLIAIDNTASSNFVNQYFELISAGFDLVSSNKIANTLDFDYYKLVRENLRKNQKQYLYETNVGAGLPLIDTIKLLHTSGENITRIKGVFSGSLSYIFNTFSESELPFVDVLKEAMDSGYTEPDPREDLSGNDVARKLLILARELELENEFSDVNIENLIPEELRDVTLDSFLDQKEITNSKFKNIKQAQKPNHVLRYVGDLHGDLQKQKGVLDVQLVSVPKASALGQISGVKYLVSL